MGTVVRLSEYRKPPPAARRDAGASPLAPHSERYFCLRCDTDQFKLLPSGAVHCAHCGALMRNITVAEGERDRGGGKP
jgi:hypothetical protein